MCIRDSWNIHLVIDTLSIQEYGNKKTFKDSITKSTRKPNVLPTMTVSYTHLNVYKRQMQKVHHLLDGYAQVYCHLDNDEAGENACVEDVYKRQGQYHQQLRLQDTP